VSGALASLALVGIHAAGVTGIRNGIVILALAGVALVFGYPRSSTAAPSGR
jgi:hypothetical protein